MYTIANAPRAQRKVRHPEHQFQLRTRPWQIQPFFIAPVLAGETMKNLLIQSRVVSDPVNSPLIGWWNEYYVFYVKLRDLDERSSFEAMVLDPNYSPAALIEAASLPYYHANNTINYTKKCLKRVTEEFFRDEGEAWDAFTLSGMPIGGINQASWLDSVRNDADYVTSVDFDVDGADAGTTIQASEVADAMRRYELARMQNLTEMTFEEYLGTFGVSAAPEADHKPELVRYLRDWTYPSSTINPANGAPTSALSWKVTERADKDRFFREPGFLFGVTICRPKVYRQNQTGSLLGLFDDAYAWLPAVLEQDAMHSFRKVSALGAPLTLNTDAWWFDARDLFLYGDQFVNYALTDAGSSLMSLPTAALQKKFVSTADADELFVTPATQNLIRQDGVVSLNILGRIQDMSTGLMTPIGVRS